MSSVAEIEEGIARLPREEFVRLERWFDAERNRRWDAQIEEDSRSGALDLLLQEAEQDAKQGKSRQSRPAALASRQTGVRHLPSPGN
ncbi:MAG: hypothetical protein J0L84_12400 [Verrucomicrobia bacterium]|nr:hypothetical protein [Verrucomicrobiota bacterium]